MATIVCQGLEPSQFESRTTLMLKLELPFKSNPQNCEPNNNCPMNSTGWSLLQALPAVETGNTYIHPLVKLNSSNLELCTENLGSETGTDIVQDSIFSDSYCITTTREHHSKSRQLWSDRKSNKSCSFPPPLKTMSGPEYIRVKPRREEGRLIIEAVKSPLTRTHFHTDRSNGRVRLSTLRDYASFEAAESSSSSAIHENEKLELEIATEEEQVEEKEDGESENSTSSSCCIGEEDVEVNNLKDGVQMGEEFQRPRRCNEREVEGKGLLIKPFWVATS